MSEARRAKIVATIGPASDSAEQLRALLQAGVDVARINMSHGDRDRHREVIQRVRQIARELGTPVAIMLDLSGPKIRTGKLRGTEVTLEEGAEVRITSEQIEGDASRFSASYALLAQEIKAGDRILLSDGEIELRAIGISQGDVLARVIHGGVLGEHKGVNLPGAQLSIPSITEKDVADLKFGVEQGVDLVAQSFVRSGADCRSARDLIAEFGGTAKLIAKIEKPEALADLNDILAAADGVMVARGDLAVETQPERVPILQKEIISAALAAEKTVITATQMLQSMILSPQPTRAEASDVANAILDGSDAVMLSGETAIGRHPVEAVKMMDRIIVSTEESATAELAAGRRSRWGAAAAARELSLGRHSGSEGRALAEAVLFAAEEIGAKLIVVFTHAGNMARRVAALRPRQRIIALTLQEATYRQLAITWGVEPYPLEHSEDLLARGDQALLSYQLAEPGETVVVMAGRMPDLALSTSLRLHRVGDLVRTSSP